MCSRRICLTLSHRWRKESSPRITVTLVAAAPRLEPQRLDSAPAGSGVGGSVTPKQKVPSSRAETSKAPEAPGGSSSADAVNAVPGTPKAASRASSAAWVSFEKLRSRVARPWHRSRRVQWLRNRTSTSSSLAAARRAFPAGLAAIEHGLRYKLIEQEDSLGGCVYHYPRNKIAMTAPVHLAIIGAVKMGEIQKEKLLEFWNSVVAKTGLEVSFRDRMENVERQPDGTFVVQTGKAAYSAKSVLLATGRRGSPRKLEVPGEESSKVVYRLVDAEQYRAMAVLVVGGGDNALEAAIALSQQDGDLPGFFGPVVPVKMALRQRGAHEEESIHGRADGRGVARGGPTSVAETAKKHKVSEQTIYAWRKHFGELRRRHQAAARLEGENARLKSCWPSASSPSRCSRRSTIENGEPAGARGRLRSLANAACPSDAPAGCSARALDAGLRLRCRPRTGR